MILIPKKIDHAKENSPNRPMTKIKEYRAVIIHGTSNKNPSASLE